MILLVETVLHTNESMEDTHTTDQLRTSNIYQFYEFHQSTHQLFSILANQICRSNMTAYSTGTSFKSCANEMCPSRLLFLVIKLASLTLTHSAFYLSTFST